MLTPRTRTYLVYIRGSESAMRMKLLRAKALKSRAYGDSGSGVPYAPVPAAPESLPQTAGYAPVTACTSESVSGGNHIAGFVLMTEHGEFSGRRMQRFEQRPRLPIQIPINRLRKIFRHDSHSLVFAVFA